MKKYILLYITISVLFSFLSYTFIDPNLIYLKTIYNEIAYSYRIHVAFIYVISIIFLYYSYISIIWKSVKRNMDRRELIIGIILVIGALFFAYPAILSYDIFNYIFTAKVAYFYHENPYIIMPIEFIGDPLLLFTRAANKTALYGPLWVMLSSVPFMLGVGNFILTLFSFKLFVTLFLAGSGWILWKLEKSTVTLLLFLLNPLILIETVVSGHNDIVMVFFLLVGLYFLKKKKIFYSLLFLLSSILIKYITVVLIPIFLYCIWQYYKEKSIRWEKIYMVIGLTLLCAMLIAAPIREEIYPWYAIWFLPFFFLSYQNRLALFFSVVFSFSLMLRYIPYMILGSYLSPTPQLKQLFTVLPVVIFFMLYYSRRIIWLKK